MKHDLRLISMEEIQRDEQNRQKEQPANRQMGIEKA